MHCVAACRFMADFHEQAKELIVTAPLILHTKLLHKYLPPIESEVGLV